MNCCLGQKKFIFKSYDGIDKKIFLIKHNKEISKIIINAFYSNLEIDYNIYDIDLESMLEGILFVCLIILNNHDEEVIGVCVAKQTLVLQHDFKYSIEPYNTLRYIHIPDNILSDFTLNKNKHNIYPYEYNYSYEFTTVKTAYIYDKYSDQMIHMIPVIMPVVIDYLAKNKNYNDVGRFLIHSISEYYKLKGINTIYIGSESVYHRHNLINNQHILHKSYNKNLNKTKEDLIDDTKDLIDDTKDLIDGSEEIRHVLKLYKDSQPPLLNYYKSCGFELMPNTYYVVKPLTSDESISSLIFYNFHKLTKI
jgi:hypothetical protein